MKNINLLQISWWWVSILQIKRSKNLIFISVPSLPIRGSSFIKYDSEMYVILPQREVVVSLLIKQAVKVVNFKLK